MDDIRSLVAAFGGQHKASRLLGVPVTTIHAWTKNNRVPVWRAEKVDQLRAAIAAQSAAA